MAATSVNASVASKWTKMESVTTLTSVLMPSWISAGVGITVETRRARTSVTVPRDSAATGAPATILTSAQVGLIIVTRWEDARIELARFNVPVTMARLAMGHTAKCSRPSLSDYIARFPALVAWRVLWNTSRTMMNWVCNAPWMTIIGHGYCLTNRVPSRVVKVSYQLVVNYFSHNNVVFMLSTKSIYMDPCLFSEGVVGAIKGQLTQFLGY